MATLTKVLVIELDDGPGGLAATFQAAGFAVLKERQSAAGLRTAVAEGPRMIIVDEMMPPIDGMELMSLLKSFTNSLIMVKGEDGRMEPASAKPVTGHPPLIVSGLLLLSPDAYSPA